MLRGAIAGLLIYGYGHPACDVFRPAALDAPLQGFHRDINTVAFEGYRALTRFDDDRAVSAVKGYVQHLDTQMRGAE